MSTFDSLGLSDPSLEVVRNMGFEEPTPIQTMVIPAILTGDKDLIGQAHTGTGKTAAFGLPILEQLDAEPERRAVTRGLVLTPTRELAIQVCKELNALKGTRKLSIVPIYGGAAFGPQLRELSQGIDIVVGTPGRVLDHIGRGRLQLDGLRFMVIDEADEMLQLGFQEEVENILRATPESRRTLLFSATMPPPIQQIARKYMGEREHLRAQETVETSSLTEQVGYEIREADRFEALCRVMDMAPEFYGIVFCRTRNDTSELAGRLAGRNYHVGALHGDFTQAQREHVLAAFRRRQIRTLVATDVAARGIDIQELTHVVNYNMPQSPDAYLHRIGRTGRAGKKGTAVSLVAPKDFHKLSFIRRALRVDIRRAELPTIDELVDLKRDQIRTRIAEAMQGTPEPHYAELARELLTWCEAEELVAVLLQRTFGRELDRERYADIRKPKRREPPAAAGQGVRLFITRGNTQGLTPKRLIKIIRRVCKIPKESIHDLELNDNNGYVTLSRRDAHVLLEYYRVGRGKPLFRPLRPQGGKPRGAKPWSAKPRRGHMGGRRPPRRRNDGDKQRGKRHADRKQSD